MNFNKFQEILILYDQNNNNSNNLDQQEASEKVAYLVEKYQIKKFSLDDIFQGRTRGVLLKIDNENIEETEESEEIGEEQKKQGEKNEKKERKRDKFLNLFKKEEKENKNDEQPEEEKQEESQIIEHCPKIIAFIIVKDIKGQIIAINAIFGSEDWELVDLDQRLTQTSGNLHDDILDYNKFSKKSELTDDLKEKDTVMFKRVTVSNALNFGQTFGYCLANINNYPNSSAFLKDLGKNMAINGTLTLILTNMPVLKVLLLMGGLSYLTLSMYQNETLNATEKWKKTGKVLLSTGTGIGTTIGGIAIGQALIPLPILGGIIGGIIGGFIGSKSSSEISNKLEKSKMKKLVAKIENLQEQEGNWKYTDEYLKIYGIKVDFFTKNQPESLNQANHTWITYINYYFLSLYYQKQGLIQQEKIAKEKEEKEKEVKKRQEKLEKLEKKQQEFQQKNQDKKLTETNEDEIVKQIEKKKDLIEKFNETKILIDQLNEEVEELDNINNEWPESIIKVQEYLIKNHKYTLPYSKEIEQWVLHVIKSY